MCRRMQRPSSRHRHQKGFLPSQDIGKARCIREKLRSEGVLIQQLVKNSRLPCSHDSLRPGKHAKAFRYKEDTVFALVNEPLLFAGHGICLSFSGSVRVTNTCGQNITNGMFCPQVSPRRQIRTPVPGLLIAKTREITGQKTLRLSF